MADFDDDWFDDNAQLLDAICRDAEEASASRNPSATPAAVTQYLPAAPAAAAAASWPPSCFSTTATTSSAPLSRVPAAPHAYATPLPRIPNVAAASPFPLPRTPAAARAPTPDFFSPPRELSQRSAASGGGFSPPRELSQRPAAEEDSECQIIEAMGSTTTDRARTVPPRDARAASQARVKTLPRGRQARAAESKSAEEIKMQRELERVLKQMNDMKNENTELKKGMKNKDLEIEAKEAEIHILKKANLKDNCNTRMDIDHAPANEALQAGGSCRTSTRRADKLNGKNKDLCSSRDGTSTSGAYLEENAHLELKSNKCMDNKAKGVQTDLPVNNEHLEHKKVPISNISSSLCAIWGRPANSMLGRSLISKILASCSEEMLTLLQSTRSPDKCENSSEGSSSMHNAISEVYDIIIKVNSDAVPVQTLLEALLNLCVVGNVVVVGRALRILYSILQNLLTHGVKSNQSVNSGTMLFLGRMLTVTWKWGVTVGCLMHLAWRI